MVASVAVSYWMIGAYVGFVSVSTLLVGLLPPLVNLPPCKDDDVRIAPLAPIESDIINNFVANFPQAQEVIQQEHNLREKRFV